MGDESYLVIEAGIYDEDIHVGDDARKYEISFPGYERQHVEAKGGLIVSQFVEFPQVELRFFSDGTIKPYRARVRHVGIIIDNKIVAFIPLYQHVWIRDGDTLRVEIASDYKLDLSNDYGKHS